MKIGTVGTNFIVVSFIEAARQTGKAEILSCYSRKQETADAFAAAQGIPRALADRDAFLGDGSLDFIYVAAPNSLHFRWARDALMAGRNVICEKPFMSNEGELREIVDLARQRGLFLFEALTVPHLPNYRLIREKLSLLGLIRLVQLNFSQYSSRYDAYLRGEDPNVFSPAFSGGALMDLNYYNLNFITGLFGPPAAIRYFPNRGKNGIDISGVLVMEYDGFVCTAAACKDSVSPNFLQIQGERGHIHSPSTSSNLRDGFTLRLKDSEEFFNVQKNPNALYYELLDFEEAFNGGDRSRCEAPLEASLLSARLIDRARLDAGIRFDADGNSR
ncbi:MAG: Gfo/Idh/MocA family oxidoreductase [Treponema sp.]|jgi:predicted dehydrogenase|nr:Gfo/Idh/MocA family oxidoreductase [Treponema sp.]